MKLESILIISTTSECIFPRVEFHTSMFMHAVVAILAAYSLQQPMACLQCVEGSHPGAKSTTMAIVQLVKPNRAMFRSGRLEG